MHNPLDTLTVWDGVLLVVVSLMGTALAYLHHPRWKAFILVLPFPFTVACLSLGRGVDATHVLGLFLLQLFPLAVRLLYMNVRLPIVPSILVPTLGYAAIGAWAAPRVSQSEGAFWGGILVLFLFTLPFFLGTPHRTEPGHRTPLPVWIKLPILVAIVSLLIVGKHALQGFMTMAPMVSILAAYEARHSLWTMSRQVAAFAMCMLGVLIVMRVVEPHAGLPLALAAGWGIYLALLLPLMRARWAAEDAAPPAPSP